MAKRRKLTNAQKKVNADIKKELQEKGILPPDKPKLNRKRFVEEATEEWNNRENGVYTWDLYLFEAVSFMLGQTDGRGRVSLEAVGVAKCLKLAIRMKEFRDKLKDEGRDTYTIGEYYKYLKDILNA